MKTPPPPAWKTLWSGLDDRSIAIPAPPNSVGIAFSVVAGKLFGGGNEQHAVADGIVAINELQRQVLSWSPSPDVYHMVGEGNALLGVGWNMPAKVFRPHERASLGVAFPEEGTISRVTTVNLVKGSRQPEAARQLIAHLLSADRNGSWSSKCISVGQCPRPLSGERVAAHGQYARNAWRGQCGSIGWSGQRGARMGNPAALARGHSRAPVEFSPSG